MKKLYNGKTQKQWFEDLSESLFYIPKKKKIVERDRDIIFYFDKDNNLIGENNVSFLEASTLPLPKEIKNKLNIDDNWKENYISIDSESLCQLLFFMNRKDILAIIKDMLNCVCL